MAAMPIYGVKTFKKVDDPINFKKKKEFFFTHGPLKISAF